VAIQAKVMPDNFFSKDNHDITAKVMEYIAPLVRELPSFSRLEPIFNEKKL